MAFAIPLLAAAAAGGGAAAAGATALTAATVAGTALSTLGTFQQLQYQSKVAKNNAEIARQNAGRASDASQQEQIRSDREYAALQGEQLAAQSASGLNLMGKSQVLTRKASAGVGRQAAMDIYQQGYGESRNFMAQEAQFRGEAKQAKLGSYMALAEGALEMGGTMMGKGAAKPDSLLGRARSTRIRF